MATITDTRANAGACLPLLEALQPQDNAPDWLADAHLLHDVARIYYGYLGAYRVLENLGYASLMDAVLAPDGDVLGIIGAFVNEAVEGKTYDGYAAIKMVIDRAAEVVATGQLPELPAEGGLPAPASLAEFMHMPLPRLNLWYGAAFAGCARVIVQLLKQALAREGSPAGTELVLRLRDLEAVMLHEGIVQQQRRAARA